MLKTNINRLEETLEVEMRGNLAEILSDIGTMAHVIHAATCRDSILVGRAFEKTLKDPQFWEMALKAREGDEELLKNIERGGEHD